MLAHLFFQALSKHMKALRLAEVQAEPEETAISFNAIINDSPFNKIKAHIKYITGTLFSMSPLI